MNNILIEKIKRKQELVKEIKQIDNYLEFYADEVHELANSMHRTAEGELMLISDMTDDHLINTYNLGAERWYKIEKYKPEIKRRNLVDRVINTPMQIKSPFCDDEDIS